MVNGIRRSVNADNEAMQHVFGEKMDQLLPLAYLMTGQHEQAVECFLETASRPSPSGDVLKRYPYTPVPHTLQRFDSEADQTN